MRVRVPAGFAQAQQLELAWSEGVDTLYKFRSYSGPSRRWVRQILKNSRIYFSTPSQFDDPFDVSPIFRHSGDPSNPKYVAALLRNQTRMAERDGLSAKDVGVLAAQLSATVHELPGRVEFEMRRELREKARMLCLSADACTRFNGPIMRIAIEASAYISEARWAQCLGRRNAFATRPAEQSAQCISPDSR